MLPLLILLTCQPDAPTSPEARRETYETIRDTCERLGASPKICEVAVVIAWRESRGRPGSVHTRGEGEYGLGLYGHAPKFWSWLLRPLEAEAFCSAGLSTVALVREFQFAARRGARTLRDLQRVHSGRSPRDDSRPERDNRWCYLLEHGPRDDQHVVSWDPIDCEDPVTAGDLGPPITAETVEREHARLRGGA